MVFLCNESERESEREVYVGEKMDNEREPT